MTFSKRLLIYLLFLIFFTGNSLSFAQNSGTITGKVIDTQTKELLIGANVLVLDTDFGASTNSEGVYRINGLPVGTYRIRIDYIGYESMLKTDIVVKISKPAFVNVELKPSFLQGKEVTVSAGYFVEEEKIQTSTIGLSREEIRRFPGGFEDIVRTVSTLPGVAINASGGRNDLLVRGGGPSENLYIINNIEVPNINHFGTQGNSSGSLSFINLDFVQDISFSTGGFGARYGDKMSSILSIKMAEERPENFQSKLTISATQYGLDFQTPIKDKTNLIFSARQSYLDLIFKAAGLPFVPIYTDFNILINYDISPKDKLFFLGLTAIDRVDRDQSTQKNRITNAGILENSQYQWIGGLNYRRSLSKGFFDLTFHSNLYQYRFSQIDENELEYFNSKVDEQEISFKAQHFWIANNSIAIRSGVSLKTILNNNSTTFADTIYDRSGNRISSSSLGVLPTSNINTNGQKYAGFWELDWYVNRQLDINAGIRFDYYQFINKPFYIAPRISFKYKLFEKLSIRTTGGTYYQSPSYVWIVNPENKNIKALKNSMGILGLDFLPRNDFRISFEGYYKNYTNLPTGIFPGVTDYLVITNTGTGYGGREDDFQSFGYYSLISSSKGTSYGLELVFQKKFSEIPCYGLAAFSYNKSKVTAGNGLTYPGQYDQRIIFNLSGGYIFNAKWEIATKFRYFTGVPYTPVYSPSLNPNNPGNIQNLPEEYLSKRLSPGHHLDIRIDRYFYFKKTTWIVYLDVQNIYNYKIPIRPSYDFGENEIVTTSSIAILPSIGISLEF